MRASGVLPVVFGFSALSAAWPWRPATGNIKAVQDTEGIINRRQDNNGNTVTASPTTGDNESSNSAAGTITASATTSTERSRTETISDGSTLSGSSDSATGSRRVTRTTGSGSVSRTSSGASESMDFDPRLPAGGIAMITPNPYSGAQYYKIGDNVTFAWNYTSLSVTPTAINVVASCTANQATYTIATNQTVEPTGEVIWDTKGHQSSDTPLLTEMYTLFVHDADSSLSAAPKPGYLAVYNQFTFGMYSPQPYTPLGEYQCATCNGALSVLERQTLGFLFGMSAITVLSFTWFAGGFGVW